MLVILQPEATFPKDFQAEYPFCGVYVSVFHQFRS